MSHHDPTIGAARPRDYADPARLVEAAGAESAYCAPKSAGTLREQREVWIVTVQSTGLSIALVLAMLPTSVSRFDVAAAAGPEDFDVKVTVTARPPATGTVVVPLLVHVERYTPEHARLVMTDALKHGGYPGFVRALREAPRAGYFELDGRKVVVRWARQLVDPAGRTLSFVTEAPVYFAGSLRQGAKPTAGYEVAVMQLRMDRDGRGDGTLAAAARVKPLNVTGVQIDDYADTPLKITAASRHP